jgi:hypothetical protein
MQHGSSVVDVVIAAAMVLLVLVPLFSYVMEKYITLEKARIIRDAVDVTNLAAYNALNTKSLGSVSIDLDRDDIMKIYKELLCTNLNLDDAMNPGAGSVAEAAVSINSLEIYEAGFPVVCSNGTKIIRPTVHSCIEVPVRPSLYRKLILDMLGKNYVEIEVHVDSELIVNN